MTDIEQKALALVNEVRAEMWHHPVAEGGFDKYVVAHRIALCHAIEQHEAFRQEVSDAVVAYVGTGTDLGKFNDTLGRFIIAKSDPLVEAVDEGHKLWMETLAPLADSIRAAIEKRGGKIVWGEG